ncbi:hypothetical protein CFR78_04360 [Komagataeibacter rhaeticus]|uniref:hypothetical protein n=1 Tax=Komagataeibacter rhaeticus TaxID=215221 RepID=UPI0004D82B88|nr:hypothetical protein [Komagataeibacter rhaeticus]KDU96481.1 hypothetical protein GLUCORHAEAF1_01835 [Komagataeibacter rhaeticus AF1]PYD54208.1 hypothetical protein CFR78_04360 [Komagataeibacter rhaeticus]GBQ15166.1 hypothetical protein AA16663_2008 [Komagataeibacter rhaeticus DSM 16663]
MSASLHIIPARPPRVGPAIVMETLRRITKYTRFNDADAFDPLLEDLILYLRDMRRVTPPLCAALIAQGLDVPAAHPSHERQNVIVTFFRSLPPRMTARLILSGLEGQ